MRFALESWLALFEMKSDSQHDRKIQNFRRMLETDADSALLRFTLGSMLLQNRDYHEAIEQLEFAIENNPDYSAAHKLLAQALTESGQVTRAIAAYETGIQVAQKVGDKQAEKEMQVFLRRLKKI